jgi:hypothetical protein
MLSYELAKQLKEAGFPNVLLQNTPDEIINYNDCPECIPTLSELIDACREDNGLFVMAIEKSSKGNSTTVGISGLSESGDSPEEAVAKLWLNLCLAK